MKLYDLLENGVQTSLENIEITAITDDSRTVQKGSLFACIKGERFDGHEVAADALAKGAAIVITERDLGLGERQIIVPNTREFYGKLCSTWFGHPEKKFKLIGITGTNGKTTIANVVKYILTQHGYKTGLIGTICNEIGDEVFPAEKTTPPVYDLMKLFDKMAQAGCEYVIMEVSSHGLDQRRVGSSYFETAVFTNLTQDHLDYHINMENYYQAKKLLFEICNQAVCNIDDEYGKRLYEEIHCTKFSYGCDDRADFYADGIKIKPEGSSFWLCYGGKSHFVSIKIPGTFNVYNMTAAIAACVKTGLPIDEVITLAGQYNGTPGRCEIIPTQRDFTVIRDYAHTPNAIVNILQSVREYTEGRLICLFGCGGNRDKGKRPLMAEAAAQYADLLIVTSDNPRDEEPLTIIDDVLKGLENTTVPYVTIVDRKEAIKYALEIAVKGDLIVLAGKGHEDYQIFENGRTISFDERTIVLELLAND